MLPVLSRREASQGQDSQISGLRKKLGGVNSGNEASECPPEGQRSMYATSMEWTGPCKGDLINFVKRLSQTPAGLSKRAFCDDGNVPYPCCAMRWPLATCGYGELEMWLVQQELIFKL